MHIYRPDKFDAIFTKFNGPAFWAWLHRTDVIAMMETASYLRRPAVEPLSPLLKEDFGHQVEPVKVRQMIGHMVRQVLETRGYHLDRSNVRITRPGNIFHFGSAYARTGRTSD